MLQTREEVVELHYKALALLRKAQCRQVNCEIIDQIQEVADILEAIDECMTDISYGKVLSTPASLPDDPARTIFLAGVYVERRRRKVACRVCI